MRTTWMAGLALALFPLTASAGDLDTPRVVVKEHDLEPVDEQDKGKIAKVSEELEPTPEWDWPQRHLAAGDAFVDPILSSEAYPEVSVGTSVIADQLRGSRAFEFISQLDVDLYLLELEIPMISTIDTERPDSRVGAALKIPFAVPGAEAHRFALVWGASIPPSGPAFSNSSRFEMLYALGLKRVGVQLNLGYGYQQVYNEPNLRQGLLYGAVVGANLGKIKPLIEMRGLRTVGTRSDGLTLIPGIQIFPGVRQNLQLGAGALFVFNRGNDAPGRRVGATAQVQYNFL